MAEKRMISRRVSKSKKLAAVSYQTEAFYYRALPFLDDAGRMTADPEEFRAEALSMGKRGRPVPLSQVEAAINEMYDIGLIGLCTCPKTRCLEYTEFGKFNTVKNDRGPQLYCKEPGVFHWNTQDSNGIPYGYDKDTIREEREDREPISPEVEELIHKVLGIKGWEFTEAEDADFFTRLLADFPITLISSVLEDLRTYQEKPAKQYKNLHSALRNWCKREKERQLPEDDSKPQAPLDANGNPLVEIDGETFTSKEFDRLRTDGEIIRQGNKWVGA